MEWVKEHFAEAISLLVAALSALGAFVWGVRKNRADHDQLRREFNEHMRKAEPMMDDLVRVQARVESLEHSTETQFAAVMGSLDELRTDFRTLNTTLIGVLKRGFGAVRQEDE